MLNLSKDMTHADAINHIRTTFPLHITHDVEPSAPFGALRSVFAGIEYVSALYAGWNGGRRIATRPNTVGFLKTFFPVATGNDAYSQFADHLYEIFRNGSVHVYVPKSLQNLACSTRFLNWCLVPGNHIRAMAKLNGVDVIVAHFVPVPIEDTTFLPVSPQGLLDDLLKACELFAQNLKDEEGKGDHPLLDRWRKTADGMSRPTEVDLTW